MAQEFKVQYFEVVVKGERETDREDKAGNPKIEKWSEKWLIHAETSDQADKIARDQYEGMMDEWHISSVKETKFIGVLEKD